MATIIRTNGTQIEIQPANGTDFHLSELTGYVGGYIEIIDLRNGEIMVVNDNGKYECERNEIATSIALANRAIFASDFIAGDVVKCKSEEVE